MSVEERHDPKDTLSIYHSLLDAMIYITKKNYNMEPFHAFAKNKIQEADSK
jgi:hypothetical protein